MKMRCLSAKFAEVETKVLWPGGISGMVYIDFVSDTAPRTIISESKPSAFPSPLRAKRSAVQTLTAEDRKTEALTQHTCAQCGRKEMYFTTVQLRSADEGSTVFYTCVCGYKYAITRAHSRFSLIPNRPMQRNFKQLSRKISRCIFGFRILHL